MNDVVTQSLVITVPLSALLLVVHYLLIRQLKAMESRLSKEKRDSTDRLCADIRDSRDRIVAWGECYTVAKRSPENNPRSRIKPQSR